MNTLEHELHYPLGDAMPAPGDTLQVAQNLHWIRMDLPFALNHINLWLLRDDIDGVQGWTVVDCCIDKHESRAQWQQIFDTQLQGLPILRVIVTHMHPDHVGLAHWLCDKWNAPLWMSATDFNAARIGSALGFGGELSAAFYATHGLSDPDSVAKIKARTGYYPALVPAMPKSYRRIMDGDVIRMGPSGQRHAWRCISGYGHAPEHISLYCESLKVLIGGDMMLPRISTNVSVFELEPEGNPLQLFLHSIDKFAPLPTDALTLPSHGKPFTGLHARIAQLHAHHRDRLAEVMDACQQKPCSATDIVPIMFKRELDLHQMTFAMGEAVAHLNYLWFEEKLRRSQDADGVFRFSTRQGM